MIDLTNFRKCKDDENNTYYKLIRNEYSKYCLITLVDSEFTEKTDDYFKYTHPQFIKYADKYSMDYIIMVTRPNADMMEICYNKFRLGKFLDEYERIIYLDADVYVRDTARNLFEIVPSDSFGIFFESNVLDLEAKNKLYTDWYNRNKQILTTKYNLSLSQILENESYYNAGMLVVPRIYKHIVSKPEVLLPSKYYDQEQLNFLIFYNKVKTFDIGKQFVGRCYYDINSDEKISDLFLGCDMFHFMGIRFNKSKKDRIEKFLELEKTITPPKKIIFSKWKYQFPDDIRDIVSQDRRNELSLRNGYKVCENITGLAELVEYIGHGDKMAELGSYVGESAELFAKRFNEVNAIDSFEAKDINNIEYESYFDKRVSKYTNIKKIKGYSNKIHNLFEDESLDFVYIDANHEYKWVSSDIVLWFPKVKKGGWIGGHDYVRDISPGVVKAVLEKFGNIDVLFDDSSWLVKKVDQFIPKVSIIIPVYNSEKWLVQCLDSAINQTYKNLEIIIVDDCSTDNSLKILEEYASKYKNITLLKNDKNMGPAYSRNKAIEVAKGEYMYPLDSDNYLELDAIEKMVETMDSTGSDVVYCKLNIFGSNESILDPPNEIFINDLLRCNTIDTGSMFRKLLWHDSKYDPKTDGYEDWDMWLQMLYKNAKFTKIDECLINYRFRRDSLNRTLHIYGKDSDIVAYIRDKYIKLKSNTINNTINNKETKNSGITVTRPNKRGWQIGKWSK